MALAEIFSSRKDGMVKQWTDLVFATYPFNTTGFRLTSQDPFANPVAQMTRDALNVLYDAVAGGDIEEQNIRASLEMLVKLRAVQQFSPSKAMGIFYLLKPLMREQVLTQLHDEASKKHYLDAESRLDSLVLLAFDIFVQAREVVSENRIQEIRKRYAQVEKWAQKLNADAPLSVEDACSA